MKSKFNFLFLLLAAPVLHGQVTPSLMSYQGRVTDAAGVLIGNSTPVNRTVTFKLYTQSSAGTPIYAETQMVTISGGEFSVLIGNGAGVSGFPGPPSRSLDAAINSITYTNLYLGITVDDGTAAVDLEISPRQQMVSGAFALRAKVAESVAGSAITTTMLGDAQVSTVKIAAGAVDGSRIANNTITAGNIANNVITAGKLDTGTIGIWTPVGSSVWRNGNVGIGEANPGFPLNFGSTLGDKIALWGNTGATYGFGIQGNLLQIHTSGSSADVAFGHGTSAAMTETMRVKGTGNVGIGTSSPAEKLVVAGTAQADRLYSNGVVRARGGDYGANSTNTGFSFDGNGDSTGGMFSGAAGTLQFYTSANERLRISSTGNVGIGNTSPNAKLTIGNNFGTTAHSSTLTTHAGTLGTTNGNELLLSSFGCATGSGNNSSLTVSAYRNTGTDWNSASMVLQMNVDNSIRPTGHHLAFGRNGIGINNVAPTFPLHISGGTSATYTYGFLNKTFPTGANYTGTATYSLFAQHRIVAEEFNAISDSRLKTGVTPILESDAMEFVNKVSAVKYHWKDGEDKGLKYGFIAQDLVKAGFNHMVGSTADPKMKEETDASGFTSPAGARFNVSYEMATPILLVAIKQLKDEADGREARIDELEERLEKLERLIQAGR